MMRFNFESGRRVSYDDRQRTGHDPLPNGFVLTQARRAAILYDTHPRHVLSVLRGHGAQEVRSMTEHGLMSYMSQFIDRPWRAGASLEELLLHVCQSLGAHAVSLKTAVDTVTVVAADSSAADAEDTGFATELPIGDERLLTIRSRAGLTDVQMASAHAWAGVVRLMYAVNEAPSTDDFVSVMRTMRYGLEAYDDEAEAAQHVVRTALRIVGGDAAWYAARTDRGLVIRADSGFDDPGFSDAWLLNVGEGVGGRAFSHGQTVIANDYLHDRRRVRSIAAMADREGIRSVLIAPVRCRDKIEGALYLMSRRTHHFHRRESDRLTVLGEELGYALTRMARLRELRNEADEAWGRSERLLRVGAALQSGTEVLLDGASLETMVKMVADTAGAAVEVIDSARETAVVAGETQALGGWVLNVTGPDDASARIALWWDCDDEVVTEHLAAGIAQLVRLNWSNQRNDFTVRRNFVATLLRKEVEDGDELMREALAVGLDLSRQRVVACVTMPDEPYEGSPDANFHDVADLLERLVSQHLSSALCVRLGGRVGILADLAALRPRDVHDAVLAVIEHGSVSRLGLVGGIGSSCTGPLDYCRSWREAQMAAQFAEHRGRPAVVTIDEIGVFSLFARVDVDSRLTEDLSLILGPLNDLPVPLLETLDAYVHSGFSVDEAARRLHIHPNTLRYRIRRLRECLGMDLRHADQRFLLELSLRVKKLLRSLGRREAPNGSVLNGPCREEFSYPGRSVLPAEAGAPETAERCGGVVGRPVDVHLAGSELRGHGLRPLVRRTPHRGRQAVRGAVGDVDRFLCRAGLDDHQDWPEDLLLGHAHVRGDVGEHRRPYEVSP